MKRPLLLALGLAGCAVFVAWRIRVQDRAPLSTATENEAAASTPREPVAIHAPAVEPSDLESVDESAEIPSTPAAASPRRALLSGIVRVRVLDDQGRPMSSAKVLAVPADLESFNPATPKLRFPSDSGGESKETGETGIAELSGLAAGNWRVWAGTEGWFHHFSSVFVFDPEGEGLELELRLTRIPDSQFIEGVVLDTAADPAPETTVAFYWKAGEALKKRSTVVDKSGRFSLLLEEPELVGVLLVAPYWGSQLRTEHLEPFVAGARDLEIRLVPADPLTLDIRDSRDLPVSPERTSTRFSLDILDHWEEPSRAGRQIGPQSIRSGECPAVLFLIHVSGNGLVSQTFGPFRPEEVGDSLLLRLNASKAVRGRVTWNGDPVEGAFVALFREKQPTREFAESMGVNQPFIRGTDSDARGEFEIPLRQSERCILRATKLPLGSGEVGPIFVDAERGMEGLEIALTDSPGEIRGRVLVPDGRAPDQVSLMFKGPGDRFLLQPDPDGSFRVDGLAVGNWTLRACRPEGLIAGIRYRDAFSLDVPPPDWLIDDAPFRVAVESGETAEVELDLSASALCLLEGRIKLTGASLSGKPQLGLGDKPVALAFESGSPDESQGDLAPDGSFRIGSRNTGPHRLRIELELQSGRQELIVLDRLEMVGGTRTWEHEIPTGELRIRVAPELWNRGPIEHRWRGAEELRVISRSPIRSEGDHAYVFPAVPAGRGEVELRIQGEDNRSVTVDVPAGGTTEIELR